MITKKIKKKDAPNDRMAKYLKGHDFKLMKSQKLSVLYLIAKIEKAMKGEKVRFTQKEVDALEGVLCLMDSVQDIAVDEYGYPKRSVYFLTKDK